MEERQFIYLNVILGPLILVEGHRRLRGPALLLINTFCCVRYFARGYGRGATFSLSWLEFSRVEASAITLLLHPPPSTVCCRPICSRRYLRVW